MSLLLSYCLAFRSDRRAVTALEYGLIAAVVVVAGLATFSVIGGEIETKFNTIASAVGS